MGSEKIKTVIDYFLLQYFSRVWSIDFYNPLRMLLQKLKNLFLRYVKNFVDAYVQMKGEKFKITFILISTNDSFSFADESPIHEQGLNY